MSKLEKSNAIKWGEAAARYLKDGQPMDCVLEVGGSLDEATVASLLPGPDDTMGNVSTEEMAGRIERNLSAMLERVPSAL